VFLPWNLLEEKKTDIAALYITEGGIMSIMLKGLQL
jgi:hypothetical protein